MNARTFAQLLTAFVLGLFVGSNLGVMLMCLLQISGSCDQAAEVATGENGA